MASISHCLFPVELGREPIPLDKGDIKAEARTEQLDRHSVQVKPLLKRQFTQKNVLMKNSNFILAMTISLFLTACTTSSMEQKVVNNACKCLESSGLEEAINENEEGDLFVAFGIGAVMMKCQEKAFSDLGLDPINHELDEEKMAKLFKEKCGIYKRFFKKFSEE